MRAPGARQSTWAHVHYTREGPGARPGRARLDVPLSDVFFVGTCNDASKLPPEFARAERFDGVFFVDLPGRDQKDAIWGIYQNSYGLDAKQARPEDTNWTGAEIKSCCRLASLLDVPLVQAGQNVVPVAVTAGDKILTGSSSYTGTTTVNAGRLSVNGVLGNTPIEVLLAAELGGSGSITGPVSVATGGTLSPGNSIASLATGTTSFATGATFEYEVDSSLLGSLGTAADLLVVAGNLDIASGALLTFADITSGTVQPFVEDTTIFAMINYSGTWNGGLFTYNGSPLADGSRFSVGSQLWEIDYDRTSPTGLANFTGDYLPSSSFVTVMAVPEPGTLVLVGIGGAIAAVLRARRRQK